MALWFRGAVFLWVMLAASPVQAAEAATPIYSKMKQHVVLLHGIGRTSGSMTRMANAVRRAGYKAENIGYDSHEDVLAVIIADTYHRIRHFSDKAEAVTHFICYSLGCLVARGIIHQHRPANLGRVVMLGPPNQGSEMADIMRHHAVANWVFGSTLPELATGNLQARDALLGTSADYELGIIAGKNTIDPLASFVLPEADDGRVPVSRTKLPGMKEHLVMDVNHTNLLTDRAVIDKALTFIQHGSFTHEHAE